MEPAVYTTGTIEKAAREWRQGGLVIVFTNGCFDLIHVGHVRYLKEARRMGDLLVVGVNSDGSVRKLKGPDRPVMPLGERLEILLSLRWVDAVVPFDDPTPLELIKAIRPHILVKGGDWVPEKIVGREVLEEYGGRTVNVPFHEGNSTTGIIRRIRSL
ncbi:MAG: D-glycero-beta-D-manno-heptose 1-phosphate adenylyltransferase [Proteobacteria bacterium]|nr:D-glycero-beta-D-manno-heptose 1-phosphate adenylyltransferase [Pseudomonadota bacterium]